MVTITLLIISISLGVASLYAIETGNKQTRIIIDDTFHLNFNEERRQGIGNFRGNGTIGDGTIDETLTLTIECSNAFVKNFSIITYSGCKYTISTNQNISYTFPTGADYYEAVFFTDANNCGFIHFQCVLNQPEFSYPVAWLSTPAKFMFLSSLSSVALIFLWAIHNTSKPDQTKTALSSLKKHNRCLLILLLILSLVSWFTVLAVNSNPLGTYENWYTDHARHSYVSSLFLKDGFSIFNEPLDTLASQDNSRFMFVTWPEMPHLYPIGSVALFLPFGFMLQNGADTVLMYKLEVALFLVVAHVCLYFFLIRFLIQRPFPQLNIMNTKKNIQILRKGDEKERKSLIREYIDLVFFLVGIYIIYTSLITFAADGMFDAVPFLFLVLGVLMFLSERYDGFLLLTGISVLFKYQTAIFLFPLIMVGIIKLIGKTNFRGLIQNKLVIFSVLFACIGGFTAFLSAPYLIQTRPEIIMNGVNSFSAHAQILWTRQAIAVGLTLLVTLLFTGYMLNKNKLLSLSAIFLLLPAFMLPYFQNWYLPYFFVYALIPQRKNEFVATLTWLIFMVIVLSFGGSAFDPRILVTHFETMTKANTLGLFL